MENIELLHDISRIIAEADTHGRALRRIVAHLADFMESDVCSIYLLNRSQDALVLSATQGLHEDAIDNVSMEPSEGLTGLAFTNNSYLTVNDASKHPRFKYFPGIGEEPFSTFIGIPLKTQKLSFGVLVFQFRRNRECTPVLEKLLKTVASIVAGMVLKFDLLDFYEEADQIMQKADMILQGYPLSEGIAIGTPVHVLYDYVESTQRHFDSENEIRDLGYAFEATGQELNDLIEKIEESGQHLSTDIFHAHLLMLQDKSYKSDIVHHISKYNKGAAFSIRHISDRFIRKFRAIPDPYLRERAADIEDICQRLLFNLGALDRKTDLLENSIVVANRLTPGETASLDMEKVGGFITVKDGPTSHTAILARSRRIPAVSGIQDLIDLTEFAETVIIDGFKGSVVVNPSKAVLDKYKRKRRKLDRSPDSVEEVAENGAGLEKHGIRIFANVSSLLDAEKAERLEADGIGLVRTEIFYLQKHGAFDLETQMDLYRQIVNCFADGPIVFRLLDIGADKKSRQEISEDNPALGLRGLRLLLKDEDLLATQLEALLTISAERPIRLLVPFITEAEEFLRTREIIEGTARKMKIAPPPIGAMIEIPSAVFILEDLLPQADFVSIGTNDLFQYFCAVDRNNPYVSNHYNPDTRAFMRLLDLIFQKTKDCGKDVEICGEIAADPEILNQLLDLGYRQFSINPYSIATTRNNLVKRFKSP
ncbi:MAG: phosphoenolpyruvate--protein phosphotransferase [Proteobacteria bacterium]|nr:phosphoenolpyruvate--protein phosphotransferase [Pseudomonadota bacterium]